jgi:hypothetical protein
MSGIVNQRYQDYDYCKRKANQAWELAGCARQDGDTKDEQRWTAEARVWEAKAIEANMAKP